MHDLLNAVLLGIVEGLTEFLPVSSTAHLLIVERLLGLAGDKWEAFTIVIQLGAILCLPAYFHRRIVKFLRTFPGADPFDVAKNRGGLEPARRADRSGNSL